MLGLRKVLPVGYWGAILSVHALPALLEALNGLASRPCPPSSLGVGVILSPSFGHSRSSLELWACKRKRLLKFPQQLKALLLKRGWRGFKMFPRQQLLPFFRPIPPREDISSLPRCPPLYLCKRVCTWA